MKKNIGRFLVEIVIIFIGITLSFFFEEYREGKRTAQQMKEVISSFLTDGELKEQELINDVKSIQQSINIIDTCFALNQKRISVPQSLIDTLIWSLTYDYGDFVTTTPSYEALKTSGLWQQLPDTLRRRIFTLYTSSYVFVHNGIKMSYEYTANLKKQFFPQLRLNFFNETTIKLKSREGDYVAQVNQALKKDEFRSAILLIRNERVKIIRFYNNAMKAQKKCNGSLKIYLSKL